MNANARSFDLALQPCSSLRIFSTWMPFQLSTLRLGVPISLPSLRCVFLVSSLSFACGLRRPHLFRGPFLTSFSSPLAHLLLTSSCSPPLALLLFLFFSFSSSFSLLSLHVYPHCAFLALPRSTFLNFHHPNTSSHNLSTGF